MALGYLMKSFGNMENDVEDVVDVYCHQCAIAMNCKELTRAFLFLANHGVNPFNQEKILTFSQSKRLLFGQDYLGKVESGEEWLPIFRVI